MNMTLIILAVCLLIAVGLITVYFIFGRKNSPFKFDIGGGSPRAAGGADASPEKTLSSRLVGLSVAVGAVFATLFARLWSMQLVSSDEYQKQADSNRTRTVTTAAPRGRILDRNGVELVTNRPSPTVVAKSNVADDDVEMQVLANLLGMPKRAVYRKIIDTSEGAQSLRTVAIDVSRHVVAAIYAHPGVFDGVSIEERTQRSYPNGTLAAHIVGYKRCVLSSMLTPSNTPG